MVNSFIECAALELAFYNIRVNGVAAGITNKNFEAISAADTGEVGTERSMFLTPNDIPFKMNKEVVNELDTAVEPKIVESVDVADSMCWL
jgi:NAD(P)-dependent dehydrogenase (short-subunit alcohol dehydrogenase family)